MNHINQIVFPALDAFGPPDFPNDPNDVPLITALFEIKNFILLFLFWDF